MQKTRVSAAGFGVTKAEPVWPATAGMRLKGVKTLFRDKTIQELSLG